MLSPSVATTLRSTERGIKMSKPYWENLPEDGNFTEDDLWDAIAESLGMDSSEISDQDLVDYI